MELPPEIIEIIKEFLGIRCFKRYYCECCGMNTKEEYTIRSKKDKSICHINKTSWDHHGRVTRRSCINYYNGYKVGYDILSEFKGYLKVTYSKEIKKIEEGVIYGDRGYPDAIRTEKKYYDDHFSLKKWLVINDRKILEIMVDNKDNIRNGHCKLWHTNGELKFKCLIRKRIIKYVRKYSRKGELIFRINPNIYFSNRLNLQSIFYLIINRF